MKRVVLTSYLHEHPVEISIDSNGVHELIIGKWDIIGRSVGLFLYFLENRETKEKEKFESPKVHSASSCLLFNFFPFKRCPFEAGSGDEEMEKSEVGS